MENQSALPYSVFTENRPLRIAFFVNPSSEKAFKVIEKIIEYNQDKWGGRYNPIILTDGIDIKEDWWNFLKNYDPDIIKSFVPISEPLLKKLNKQLSPYLIEDFEPNRGPEVGVYIQDDGLSVLPTKESISQVTGFSIDSTDLVLFEINRFEENQINTFIKVNFGPYEPSLTTSSMIRDFPNIRHFNVNSDAALCTALTSLNSYRFYVYPSLMCTVPTTAVNTEYDDKEENFTVIVGDSINDIVYYWNRIFSVNFNNQNKLKALWINSAMAHSQEIISALNTWIKRAVDPGGSGQHTVRFVSFSLEKDDLEQIGTQIVNGTFFGKSIEIKTTIPLTKFEWDPNLPGIKDRLHPIRVSGDEVYISVKPPDIEEGVMGGQHWMTDVYIEFHPERFNYISGVDYWWQLPRHNDLAVSLFRAPSRICGNGIPAVLLKRDVSFSPFPNNKIKIKLPDDHSIFQTLIVGERRPFYTSDPRQSLAERPFYNTGYSDKGKYLWGLLDLFSGLHSAYSFFEKSYWRRVFDILSQQNPRKDEVRKAAIINRLNKEFRQRDFSSTDDREWLAEYILRLSKEQSSSGKELPYVSFKKEAEKEVSDYNLKHPQNPTTLSEEDLKQELGDLIDSDILSIGIKPRCPSCGLVSWNHIDEAKQVLSCKGCGYRFGINPEQLWYYKLNSLVQEGVSRHYLIPVILTLGHILDSISIGARSSFIYVPSLDLFEQGSLDSSFGDLDIVCIKDGQFIIGEVKNTCSLFEQSDFDKMEIIAKRIMPNKVIFSSLDQKPTPIILSRIRELSEKLKPNNITVNWLVFDSWLFDPSPL